MFFVYKSGDDFIFELHWATWLRGSIDSIDATAGWVQMWRFASLGVSQSVKGPDSLLQGGVKVGFLSPDE